MWGAAAELLLMCDSQGRMALHRAYVHRPHAQAAAVEQLLAASGAMAPEGAPPPTATNFPTGTA